MILWAIRNPIEAALAGATAILFLAACMLGVMWSIASGDAVRSRAERDAFEKDVGICQSSNESQQVTIATLRATNSEWATTLAADLSKSQAAVVELRQQANGYERRLVEANAQRHAIYHGDSNAQAWADAVVPDAIADRLRAPADRSH